jgi:hypothetical protein
MGAVSFSLDLKLVLELKKVLPMTTFVETGTFEGDTVERAIPYFESIHSVELSQEYYEKVVERFKGNAKVHLYLGQSPETLHRLKPALEGKSVLFWLDAHWCIADQTAGGESQCPLLKELQALSVLGNESVLIIDDARLFLSPPPYPHEVSQWPSLEEVLEKLRGLSANHEIMITNDILIYYPVSVRSVVREYAYRNSIDWLQTVFKSRNYDNVKAEFESLHVQFDGLQHQLEDKDEEIRKLLGVSEERLEGIKAMQRIAEERLVEINSLKEIAEERARVMHLINEELETIKRHWAYRLASKAKRIVRR